MNSIKNKTLALLLMFSVNAFGQLGIDGGISL